MAVSGTGSGIRIAVGAPALDAGFAPGPRLRRMAGRIHEEDIALVRERARIDDVVRDYVALRPAGGGSFKGLCPFHDEKTPVSPSPRPGASTTVSDVARAGTSSPSCSDSRTSVSWRRSRFSRTGSG